MVSTWLLNYSRIFFDCRFVILSIIKTLNIRGRDSAD
jgi:hypothetical protein